MFVQIPNLLDAKDLENYIETEVRIYVFYVWPNVPGKVIFCQKLADIWLPLRKSKFHQNFANQKVSKKSFSIKFPKSSFHQKLEVGAVFKIQDINSEHATF